MSIITFYKLSGIFIILVSIGFSISQIGITKLFNYPKILREPVKTILQKYYEGGKRLRFFWTLFAFSSLLLIPLSALFYKILDSKETPYLLAGTSLGMAAGIFYVLGLMRWVFLAEDLSKKYIEAKEESKLNYEIVFQAFHVYCGNSIGETMGFICMGLWIAITGAAMVQGHIFPMFIGIGLIVSGIGIFLGPLEWLGFKAFNKVNKLAMKLLMVFLLCAGIRLIVFGIC